MTQNLWWYSLIAVIVTVYQGYRGFMFQWILSAKKWPDKSRRIVLLCIADTILYVVCSSAGFASLWFAYQLTVSVSAFLQISTGASVLLIFLWLFGILGVAGQLPHLVQQGKLPGMGVGK